MVTFDWSGKLHFGSYFGSLRQSAPYLIMISNFVTMSSNYLAIYVSFSVYLVH